MQILYTVRKRREVERVIYYKEVTVDVSTITQNCIMHFKQGAQYVYIQACTVQNILVQLCNLFASYTKCLFLSHMCSHGAVFGVCSANASVGNIIGAFLVSYNQVYCLLLCVMIGCVCTSLWISGEICYPVNQCV